MHTTAPTPICYQGVTCELAIASPAAGIVVITISGHDVGEFGARPTEQLKHFLSDEKTVELFVDARHTKGVSIDVSAEWARWLAEHRAQFRRINMLTGSRFIQVTADFVRRFSSLEDLMRIYMDAAAFDELLASRIALQALHSIPWSSRLAGATETAQRNSRALNIRVTKCHLHLMQKYQAGSPS